MRLGLPLTAVAISFELFEVHVPDEVDRSGGGVDHLFEEEGDHAA